MFKLSSTPDEPTDLETAITDLISEMKGYDGHSEEYTAMSSNLKTLMEARSLEDNIDKPWRPSADTVALVAGNILGIVAILTFEKANVITTKSLSLIMKPRV